MPPPFVPRLFDKHSDSSKEMTWGSSGPEARLFLLPAQSPEPPDGSLSNPHQNATVVPVSGAGKGKAAQGGCGGHASVHLCTYPHSLLCTRAPGLGSNSVSADSGMGCLLQEATLGWPEPTGPGSHF